jgi:Tfp pilus assembly protein PilO
MPYKTRNTLILLGFLIIILAVGAYFIVYSYPKKLKQVKEETQRVNQQINAMSGLQIELYNLQKQIKEEQEKLAQLDKQILPDVTPAMTYSYLNSILGYAGFVKFDMLYIGSRKAQKYAYNIYDIKGEASFDNIYKFIWYLEKGPQIYRISRFDLRGVETRDEETKRFQIVVPFQMEIHALYADVKDLPPIKKTLVDVKVEEVKNPFVPYVYRELPPNTRGLLEVERADLKAIIPGRAFVSDHTGKIHVLKEGDEVYLGYVTKIDVEKNQVEFTLNKAGIVEKFVLKLRFEQQK